MKSRILQTFIVFMLLAACRSTPTITPEQRAQLADLWSSYQRQDAGWPARRAEALKDPISREFLVNNLVRELVLGADEAGGAELSRSPRADRARRELVAIGAAAAPLLVAFFPAKDPGVAAICSQVVAEMGEEALVPLREAVQAREARSRRWAASTLARMEPPREREALLRLLREDPEWTVRGAAAEALGRFRGDPPVAELTRALEDPDPFVREQAAAALHDLGFAEALRQKRSAKG